MGREKLTAHNHVLLAARYRGSLHLCLDLGGPLKRNKFISKNTIREEEGATEEEEKFMNTVTMAK